MVERIHRGVGRTIWYLLVAAAVALALYVSFARVLLSHLDGTRALWLEELVQRSGVEVDFAHISGDLEGFSPSFTLRDGDIDFTDNDDDHLRFDSATVVVDAWDSLVARQLRFRQVTLNGVRINVIVSDDNTASAPELVKLSDFLRSFERVDIAGSSLALRRGNAAPLSLGLDLTYRREGSFRRFNAVVSRNTVPALSLRGSGVGDPLRLDRFAGEIYASLSLGSLSDLASLVGLEVQGTGQTEVWYQVSDRRPSVAVRTELRDVVVSDSRGDDAQLRFSNVGFKGAIDLDSDDWRAQLEDILIAAGGEQLEVPRLQLRGDGKGTRVKVAALDLEQLERLTRLAGVLPERVAVVTERLSPTGVIRTADLLLDDWRAPLDSWSIVADVNSVSTRPYENVPGLSNISATLIGADSDIQAWIDSPGFVLELPQVYEQPLVFDRVTGRLAIRWDGADWLYLEDGLLNTSAPEHDARVQFGMDIPLKQGADPVAMNLTVAADSSSAMARDRYIPYTLNQSLLDWLDKAIPKGEVERALFIWRGGFLVDDPSLRSYQLGVGLSATTLAFDEKWPQIEDLAGTLLIDDARVSVWSDTARMAQAALDYVSVEAAVSSSSSPINIAASFFNNIDDGLSILERTPLVAGLEPLIDDISVSGHVAGDLALSIPLGSDARTRVDLDLSLRDASAYSQALDLRLSDLNGTFSYTDTRGFFGSGLEGRVFGSPVTGTIGGEVADSDDAPRFQMQLKSVLESTRVMDWLDLPETPAVRGASEVTVDIVVADESRVSVSSELVGIDIALPAPLGKQADEPTRVSVDFPLDDPSGEIPFFWYARAVGEVYREDGAITGALVDVTPSDQPFPLPKDGAPDSFTVTGFLPEIDITAWLGAKHTLDLDAASSSESYPAMAVKNLTVARVLFQGQNTGKLGVGLRQRENTDVISLEADWFQAEFLRPRSEGRSALLINTLDLERMPSRSREGGDPKPPVFDRPLEVVVANLIHRDESLGALRFQLETEPESGNLRATAVRGQLAGIYLDEGSEMIWWVPGEAVSGTSMTLAATLGDIGNTLEQLGSERVIETDSGELVARLSWPGTPGSLNLEGVQGELDLKLEKGAFLPVPAEASGLLKLIGVFNVSGLLARADITQLFDPGLTFDSATGAMTIGGGQLDVSELTLVGSGGDFKFDSDIDLIQETIDGELIVTLPLADNIPWVAALAGGLPIAAGAFLISKVFEDQVKQLTSGIYSVEGSLDEPIVKFERLFDATSTKTRSREQEAPEVETTQ
ncbi:hypothetical protein NOR51B_67 [Luminiphilus syltensis NOR5-1B]|uniref:YhdP central domain-containing protein n=1 Tax=Luminiphilus syltensis NOR5-1B TaxID=565045 RepID=B8KR93_9GAMM|nr:AsmA-like C-terminal region-containing protein [Luminiphilus syltensis]EED34130.1 hypothetical protein NOR51B_67 [Luminiphilus syltensis NOR5-1B]